jgi:hypothetical protein
MALLWPLFAQSAWAQKCTVVAGKTREGLLPLFARWAWAQTSNVVAGKDGEGAALASVRLFGEGSASHCAGGHES